MQMASIQILQIITSSKQYIYRLKIVSKLITLPAIKAKQEDHSD